jgi:hypothetical protein
MSYRSCIVLTAFTAFKAWFVLGGAPALAEVAGVTLRPSASLFLLFLSFSSHSQQQQKQQIWQQSSIKSPLLDGIFHSAHTDLVL